MIFLHIIKRIFIEMPFGKFGSMKETKMSKYEKKTLN
jgi:hypothetical protein